MPRTPRSEKHCQYVSPVGRQCRQLRDPGHPSFCQHHSRRPQQALNEASAAQLLGQIEDFTSAAPVNQFLANLLKMTARGLIARRDAAVLAYIAQSLLNGLAARRRELLDEQAIAEDEPTRVIWDIPRPRRDDASPSHAAAAPADSAKPQLPPEECTGTPVGSSHLVPLPSARRRGYNGTEFETRPVSKTDHPNPI